GEDALLAVEGDEALALPGGADADPRAANAVEVEGVERLAGLEENVVGDVDQIAQRAHAAGLEARLHPARRGPEAHALHHARRIAPAALRPLDGDRCLLLDGRALLHHLHLRP